MLYKTQKGCDLPCYGRKHNIIRILQSDSGSQLGELPSPIWQEKSLRTPDSLSRTCMEGLGTRLFTTGLKEIKVMLFHWWGNQLSSIVKKVIREIYLPVEVLATGIKIFDWQWFRRPIMWLHQHYPISRMLIASFRIIMVAAKCFTGTVIPWYWRCVNLALFLLYSLQLMMPTLDLPIYSCPAGPD